MKDINLLPEEIKSTSPYSTTKQKVGVPVKFILVAVFFVILFAVSFALPKLYVKQLEMQLNSIESKINDSKFDEVKKVNSDIVLMDGQLSSKKDIMASIDKVSYPVNEVLVSITNAVPKGCVINSVVYKGTKATIKGKAENKLLIAELVSKIDRLDFLSVSGDVRFDELNIFELTLQVGQEGSGSK